MEGTGDGSVEPEDPREWSPEKVVTFVRELGAAQCFQSAGDQVLELGVDGSVFFDLSLNNLQGVCGHARAYDRMCAFTHNSTDARASTVLHCDRLQLYTLMTHATLCNVPVLLFRKGRIPRNHRMCFLCIFIYDFLRTLFFHPPPPAPPFVQIYRCFTVLWGRNKYLFKSKSPKTTRLSESAVPILPNACEHT
jgi:hypothetical protein